MINETVFETIDTKEKAYWLGFLYADGYIAKKRYKLQVCLSVKDEEHLDSFINFLGDDLNKKRYYGPYKTSGKQVHYYTTNRQIVNSLISLGCTNKKSKTIRFPNLTSYELQLSFLKGYYDGDGTAGKNHTDIVCGSLLFLEDLKIIFNITNTIHVLTQKYECYKLYVGVEVFREMVACYPQGLQRKTTNLKDVRTTLENREYQRELFRKQSKLQLSKEELQQLVDTMPLKDIAAQYGIVDMTVKRRCKALQITLKPMNYWRNKRKIST